MVTSTLKSSKDSSTDTFPLNYWPLHSPLIPLTPPPPHTHTSTLPLTHTLLTSPPPPPPPLADISTLPLTPLTHSLPSLTSLPLNHKHILCPDITDTFGPSLPLHHWLFYPYNTPLPTSLTLSPHPPLNHWPVFVTDEFSVFLAGCASWFASLIYPSCAPAKWRPAWRQQHRLSHTALWPHTHWPGDLNTALTFSPVEVCTGQDWL